MRTDLNAELRGHRLIAVVICMGAAASAAMAQADGPPKIEFNTRNAESLTDAHRKSIETHVKYWVDQMVEGSPAAVAEAKDELASMLEGNASKAFRDAYSGALGAALPAAAQHERVQVRLSAMIAASGATTGAVAEVCNRGLADPNVGVRYQAAKAVADVLERRIRAEPPPFNNAQQQALLATLAKMMPAEESELVFEQMGRAISNLTIPAAFDESLRLLDNRLRWLRAHPEEPPRAAQEMLRNLRLQLVEREVMAQNVRGPMLQLTAAAGRYLRLLAERIAIGQISEASQLVWGELIEAVEADIFKPAVERFAPDVAGQGPSLTSRVRRGQWDASDMGADIAKWVGVDDKPGLLTTSAIGIPVADLALPPLPQAKAQPAPAAPAAAP